MKLPGIRTNIDIEIKSQFFKTVLIVLLCMLLLFFIVYPIAVFSGSESQLRTQTAISRTVYKTIDTNAFVIRKELLIKNSSQGTVIPVVGDGNKVAVGDTVANIYSDGNAAESAARLEELQTEIDYFVSISSNSGNTLQADIEFYKKSVNESLYSLSDAVEGNELSDIYMYSRKFREALTKKQIAMGKQPDVSGILSELRNEYDTIKSNFSENASVTALNSGYYVSSADGYEDSFDFNTVKKIDYKQVEELLTSDAESISSDTVGKIITDFNWYVVLNIDRRQIGTISEGSTVNVTFSNSSVGDILMNVVAVNPNEGTDITTLVLSSNIMNEDIAQLRNVTVKLRVAEYEGLAVDNQALRTLDGEKGVYIKVGNIIKFRKVSIIYNDETMILTKAPEGGKGYLELYDEIVLEGTELYDSKLID